MTVLVPLVLLRGGWVLVGLKLGEDGPGGGKLAHGRVQELRGARFAGVGSQSWACEFGLIITCGKRIEHFERVFTLHGVHAVDW